MRILRFSLAYLVLPSIIFAVLKYHYFIIRGLVNIDYLMAGAVVSWFGPILGGIALAFSLLFDIMVSFAPAFHFKAGGFMESVSELLDIEADYVLLVALCILAGTILYTTVSLKISGRASNRLRTGVVMIALLVAMVGLDAISTGNALKKGDTAKINTNIATSSTFEAFRQMYRWSRHTPPTDLENISAASDPVRHLLDTPEKLPRNIVLIVVESWGLFKDEEANQLQISSLRNNALENDYTVTVGEIPYFYSTVPGELRELCGVMMPTIDPDVEVIPASRCLPIQLASNGYKTTGAHGFAGNFFNRRNWYPELGFDDVMFARDIDRHMEKHNRCGVAFSGLCDGDVMDVLRKRLLDKPNVKQFIYWLTLNGHTPFPEPDDRFKHLDCTLSQPSAEHESVCRLMGIQNIVLASAVETALLPLLPETAFILVGDHAPPFLEQKTRSLFSQEKVPYAILWPKSKPLYAAR